MESKSDEVEVRSLSGERDSLAMLTSRPKWETEVSRSLNWETSSLEAKNRGQSSVGHSAPIGSGGRGTGDFLPEIPDCIFR